MKGREAYEVEDVRELQVSTKGVKKVVEENVI